MLKKSERLTKKQFDTFFAEGKRWHFPHCTIVYSPYPTLYAAVVVGKKVSKLAVRRNTLRRRVYALLHRTLKTAGVTGVFIVLLKPVAITLPRKLFATELANYIAVVLKKT